jgi:hypothetical protein
MKSSFANAIIILSMCLAWAFTPVAAQVEFEFISGTTLGDWQQEGEGQWIVEKNAAKPDLRGRPPAWKLTWQPNAGGGAGAGILRSGVFTIQKPLQEFDIAGLNGFSADRQGDFNRIRLLSYPGGEILRETTTNGYMTLSTERWFTPELKGKKVRLEIFAPGLLNWFGTDLVWLSVENYRQADLPEPSLEAEARLQAVKIDEGARPVLCRSMPFLAAAPGLRGESSRNLLGDEETIPVNAEAEALYLLGMINHGWEHGVAHWGEHPETLEKRQDQNYIGNRIGTIRINYKNGDMDEVPLVVGSTIWFSSHWSHGASHEVSVPCREPFASRPDYLEVLRNTLLVKEDLYESSMASDHQHFYLALKSRPGLIRDLQVLDHPGTRGRPLISGITIAGKKQKGLFAFGKMKVDADDLAPVLDPGKAPDIQKGTGQLAGLLYTRDEDLPRDPVPVELPGGLDATSIRFIGGAEAAWLSNIWAANLAQIHDKFDVETGYFRETGADCPWYGGYSGIGTWNVQGIYPAAYSRTSDHFVTLALRHINIPRRETSFVDFCDSWLYFYRNNRDPEKGPPNDKLDIERYPADAPPHWSMELSRPPTADGMIQINEIPGDEEMDGHATTIIARWAAWRLQGGLADDWLLAPRVDVYGKSRWQSTADATRFITWLMDYTGRDLVYSEGEFTGWGGIGNGYCLVPEGMFDETDPVKIRQNYANANMYEPYPNYACMTALLCAAEMADSAGAKEMAAKWRRYASTIRDAMVRQLIAGDHNNLAWRISPYSVLTTFQDRLVQAWLSLYIDGLDPQSWDQETYKITRNTFREHMQMPYGHAPALAMGYGQGWLTHASLILDEMDDAGPLLVNLAKYSYDKNMDYADPERGVDWRRWMWIVPEGSNILPDGSWHRINDLSNGANQGPAMHALEACAGVDDTDPSYIRIMPRLPDPLDGIEVENHFVLVPGDDGLQKARVSYRYEKGWSFSFRSDRSIPRLSVRLGPWESEAEVSGLMDFLSGNGLEYRVVSSGSYRGKAAWWIWADASGGVSELNISLKE